MYILNRDIHSTSGKLRRAAMQFTPERWSSIKWLDPNSNIMRVIGVYILLVMFLVSNWNWMCSFLFCYPQHFTHNFLLFSIFWFLYWDHFLNFSYFEYFVISLFFVFFCIDGLKQGCQTRDSQTLNYSCSIFVVFI